MDPSKVPIHTAEEEAFIESIPSGILKAFRNKVIDAVRN
jgi:hypothetical protein